MTKKRIPKYLSGFEVPQSAGPIDTNIGRKDQDLSCKLAVIMNYTVSGAKRFLPGYCRSTEPEQNSILLLYILDIAYLSHILALKNGTVQGRLG
jgi:hypothetical protein